MKWSIILLLSILVLTECKSSKIRDIKIDKEDDDSDNGQEPSFDEDWSLNRGEYLANEWLKRFSRNYKEKKYTQLKLNRNMFYYWDSVYKNWTNWTSCNPLTCLSSRNRECKDNSWQEKVVDFRVEAKCPVQYIYERKQCRDVKQCQSDPTSAGNNDTKVLPKSCGKRPEFIKTKIYGGRDSIKNSWPWHGGLYVTGRYKKSIYVCGATIINPGWAVTAAHCLRSMYTTSDVPLGEMVDTKKYKFYRKFQLVFGDHDRSEMEKSEIVTKISHFIIHPSFRADYTSNLYDVALLKLETNIPQNYNIDYACVPELENYTLPSTAQCHAIGWGFMESQNPFNIWSIEFNWLYDKYRRPRRQKSRRNPNILQEVEIPLVDFKNCQKVYRIFSLQPNIHICAGSLKKDTCQGDSGGGLFCMDPDTNRWQLYGITNFGSARGCGKNFGVYVRVAAISKWIRDTVKRDIV